MIPTLILFGLIFGRWWRSAIAVATVGWVALLVIDDAMKLAPAPVFWAALFAAANTSVGVLIHQAVRWTYRRIRAPRSPAE